MVKTDAKIFFFFFFLNIGRRTSVEKSGEPLEGMGCVIFMFVSLSQCCQIVVA